MKCGQRNQPSQRTDVSGETQEDISPVANHSTDDLQVLDESTDSMNSGLRELLRLDSEPDLQELNTGQSTTPQLRDETGRRQQQPTTERKEQINWPRQVDKKSWSRLDEDLDGILKIALQGNIESKIRALSAITYSVGMERFGVAEKVKPSQPHQPNRWEKEIQRLRVELKFIRRQYKSAREDGEKEGLKVLRDMNYSSKEW